METGCKHSQVASGTRFPSASSQVSTPTIFRHLNIAHPLSICYWNIMLYLVQKHYSSVKEIQTSPLRSDTMHFAHWGNSSRIYSAHLWRLLFQTQKRQMQMGENEGGRGATVSFNLAFWPYRAFAIVPLHPLIIQSLFWCEVWKDDRGRGLKGILLKRIVKIFNLFTPWIE